MEKFTTNKEKIKKIKENAKGITLVALVITIIIIIILSTVAISFAFGDNGLIKRAEDAGDYYANDTLYTEESITNVEAYLDEAIGNVKMVESADETPISVPVPKGFTASSATGENTVKGGFVIYQGEEAVTDENVEDAQKSRNQFVWIPVNDEDLAEMYNTTTPETATDIPLSKSTNLNEETTTTKLYSKLRVKDGGSYTADAPGSTNAREPDILIDTTEGDTVTGNDARGINLIKKVFEYNGTDAEVLKRFAQDMVDEYEEVFNSIKKYGGFYIGRYELTGTADKPTVQREKTVLTAVATGAGSWYGLKDACNKIVNNDKVASTMIYGNQWDEVMDWLVDTGARNSDEINIDSSGWGNYSDNTVEGHGLKRSSGYSNEWSTNNIYDLAGNLGEVTQEANGIKRVCRRRKFYLFRLWIHNIRKNSY